MKNVRIVVIDCDNFFVSCERSQDETLLNKAVCVLGNNDGCVIARSNEAKKLGIPMGYPYFKAEKEYHQVIFLSGNHTLYKKISKQVFEIIGNYTPDVEQYSIDEGFFDISKIRKLMNKSDYEIVKMIKDDIYKQLKIPVSVGIAPTKTLAKMATEIAKKTNGIYLFEDDKLIDFLKITKLEDVWGIGRYSLPKLKDFGIKTAYDLVMQDDFWIQKLLTKRGLDLKYELLGQIRNPINSVPPIPKSLQSTRTFAEFTNNKQKIKDCLMEHLTHLCKKMRKHYLKAQGLIVILKEKEFVTQSQKMLFKFTFNSELEVQKNVFMLLDKIWQKDIIYRSCGICVYNIQFVENEQISLFEENKNEKYENLSKTMDKLEEKFGIGTLKIGHL